MCLWLSYKIITGAKYDIDDLDNKKYSDTRKEYVCIWDFDSLFFLLILYLPVINIRTN